MVWGLLGVLFWVLFFVLFALRGLRKGHWMMFILGFFLPLFWLIGALIPPTVEAQYEAR